jgi:DEAD/DEAH box helicase domain-containing protein
MKKIVFDIETKNVFEDVGKADPALLDISLVGIYDCETDTYASFLEEEFPQLWKILEKADILIGYNSDHFDIPLLSKYYPGSLADIKSIDLLREIKKASGRRFKLDSIAKATLGQQKSGNGLQAITWWKNGEIEMIRKYCLEDVRITKELYDYARANGVLKYHDLLTGVHDIPLDTSTWEDIQPQAKTSTLPF